MVFLVKFDRIISMEKEGLIFNIQKFSIHDGPGIRTTVFFKACPLRCKWCANPESQNAKPQLMLDSNTKEQKLDSKYQTAKEVFDICMQDTDFYKESGGGVTFSGGEAMLQPDFALELLEMLKKENIHVAIETTGFVNTDVFQKLAPKFDLLLFDFKHYDSDKHFEGTGVHNEKIIENLKWTIDQKINVLVRIPVIPGFNYSLEDAKGMADKLSEIGVKDVQLLPFHQMGERKYEFLNRDYELKDLKALHKEELIPYQQVLIDKGLNCFI